MALAFWGGFASGMSDSIEKNRDRNEKNRIAKDKALAKVEEDTKKQVESNHKTNVEANKRMFELSQEKQKIRSGKWSGTEDERIDEINRINDEMRRVWKSSNDYLANNGSSEMVDITQFDTADLGAVKVDGEKYVVPQDLAASIIDSNGEMKLVGNEVHQRVYEQGQNGNMIPKKDADGNDVYEHSGTNLRKYNDVFNQADEGKSKEFNISELPEKEQNILSMMGYKKSDVISSSLRTKLVGQGMDRKPIALKDGSEVFADAEGIPLRDKYGNMIFKKRSKEATDMIKTKASLEGVLEDLDRGYDVVKNNPEAVGSIGNNTADWIGNKINDFLKVPTKTRLQREKLLQFTEALAAQLRKAAGETGVMTEPDLQRYLKMLPTPDDSPTSYVSKYKEVRDAIKSKYGNLEEGFYDKKPSEKLQEKAEVKEVPEATQIEEVMKLKGYSRAKAKRFLEWKRSRGE